MYTTRFASFFRLTALGAAVSLVGVTLAPLAHAQAAAGPSTTAPAKPAKAAMDKPAPKAAKSEAKADAGPKPPDKKTRDNARKAYSAGEKAFGEGKFGEAHTSFTKADSLIPSPHAKYWIAKSLDKQDKSDDAIQAYEALLGDPDVSRIGEEKLSDAKARLDELKLKLIDVVNVVTVPPGAVVAVDGNPEPGLTPLSLKLAPGPHKLTLTATGYESKDVELNATAGDKSEQRIELAVKPPPPPVAPPPAAVEAAPPPPPPPPVEKRSMVPAYVTLGIAGAGAIVGTIFGAKALSSKSDFNKNPTTKSADDTERNALISDMAFGVAITLGVTGIVLLTSDDDASKDSAKAAPRSPFKVDVGGYAGKNSGGAHARLTF